MIFSLMQIIYAAKVCNDEDNHDDYDDVDDDDKQTRSVNLHVGKKGFTLYGLTAEICGNSTHSPNPSSRRRRVNAARFLC